ncbi:hypothetical protein CNECB9_5460021 [Cupriavidus necator]|uniref:Uncharacterized protein n=1 Tax=Cupriavidus necator TaxID=106590 RepID=A0A1K0J2G2_CUPNE|nr:hypothetical protein CNECB9_5460021 [Cupriavidus necator]
MHYEYFGAVTCHMWTATLSVQANMRKCSIRQFAMFVERATCAASCAVVLLPGGAEH